MSQSRMSRSVATPILNDLFRAPRFGSLGAVARRFVGSLRIIALHERAGRDAIPELAARLGHVEVAAKSLILAQAITRTWPENIHVSRFCCDFLTHDEATIAAMLDAASCSNITAFKRQVEGLVRPDRIHDLWLASLSMIEAERRAA